MTRAKLSAKSKARSRGRQHQKEKKRGPKRGTGSKLNLEVVFQIYDYARQGMNDAQIAQAVGVSTPTLYSWRQKRKSVALALTRGRGGKSRGGQNFAEYVHGRLSPDLKELWDEIHLADGVEADPQAKIEELFLNRGVRARQRLYVHALIQKRFNPTEACKLVNISKGTLELWCKDPQFARLLQEMDWHKQNFFEDALYQQVEAGNTAAVIFANKTKNADRGYSEKVKHQHEHSHQHTVSLDINELDLDFETKLKVLEAVRKKEQQAPALPAHDPEVVSYPTTEPVLEEVDF